MNRDELVAWLDDFLDVNAYSDASMNGLQVEGRDDVSKVAVAVDGSLSAIDAAAEAGADLLLVHHGLFWGAPLALRGPHRRRVEALLRHGLNLYAAHLPLDAHREVGNNWGLARLLGLGALDDFGSVGGLPLGVRGAFDEAVPLRDLADRIEKELGESVLVHAGGPMEVETLGIISGAASREITGAARAGLDAFLTGEPKHDTFHDAFEGGINALFAGHYMTETVGVNLLAERLEREFGLDTEFLLLPTGL